MNRVCLLISVTDYFDIMLLVTHWLTHRPSMVDIWIKTFIAMTSYGLDSVSNHQPRHCLLSRLFGCRSKKTSKLRVTGLCAENSPETGEFPTQRASNAENVSIWWRHHVIPWRWTVADSYWYNNPALVYDKVRKDINPFKRVLLTWLSIYGCARILMTCAW